MKAAFDFLKEIKDNNNREWFAEHKPTYDMIYADIKNFFNQIHLQLSEYDSIEKVNIFRIYRDIRFKKDKTPYKTNFGASFSRAKPALRGGYYVHLEPGYSFIAGGFWAPSPEDLLRIRKEFEYSTDSIKAIEAHPNFKKYFGALVGEELKTAPKGFDKNDPGIAYIRKKQFLAVRQLSDKEVFAKDFDKEILSTFLALREFFDYMSEVLTTDLNGESIL